MSISFAPVPSHHLSWMMSAWFLLSPICAAETLSQVPGWSKKCHDQALGTPWHETDHTSGFNIKGFFLYPSRVIFIISRIDAQPFWVAYFKRHVTFSLVLWPQIFVSLSMVPPWVGMSMSKNITWSVVLMPLSFTYASTFSFVQLWWPRSSRLMQSHFKNNSFKHGH